MENLIDYLIYALVGQDVHLVSKGNGADGRRQWLLNFGYHRDVTLVFDEADIEVIKYIAANRPLDEEERERYERFFELCK